MQDKSQELLPSNQLSQVYQYIYNLKRTTLPVCAALCKAVSPTLLTTFTDAPYCKKIYINYSHSDWSFNILVISILKKNCMHIPYKPHIFSSFPWFLHQISMTFTQICSNVMTLHIPSTSWQKQFSAQKGELFHQISNWKEGTWKCP